MKEKFKTTDIALASALVTNRLELKDIQFLSHSKGVFVFEWTEELEEVRDNYWKGRLLGDLLTFYKNWRDLKSRVSNVIEF